MKVDLIKIKQMLNVKYIYANFGVRSYEDSELNGVEDDSTPPKMPCYDKEDKRWKLTIDVDNGQITNWKKGNTAKIHYKVCDDGEYKIFDKNMIQIGKTIHSYVPKIFAIDDDGYGDYVIMTIDENGFISDWNIDNEDIDAMFKNDFYYDKED